MIFDAVLLAGLVAHWLGTPTAWSVLVSGSAAVVSGALTIGGDTLKSSTMSRRPLTLAVSLLVVLAITAVLTLFVATRTLSGHPIAGRSDANAADAAPFVVGVNAFAAGGCGTYRFDQPVEALAPIPRIGSGDLASWLSEHKAIQSLPYGRFTGAKLIVNITGDTDSPVTITGVSFRTLGIKQTAAEGAAISGQCGGETVGRFIEVDLDKSPPKILATNDDPNGTWGAEPVDLTPIRFPYTVKNGDSAAVLRDRRDS